MVVIEKSLNGSYYKMNPIYMEDATTGIYTTKYNPQWYSAQSSRRIKSRGYRACQSGLYSCIGSTHDEKTMRFHFGARARHLHPTHRLS